MRRFKQYWAYYQVYSHSVLQDIQKELSVYLPKRYIRTDHSNYHMTVHPQFQVAEENYLSHESMIKDIFPSSIQITALDFHFNPSRSEPRVISLNVKTDIPLQSKPYLDLMDHMVQL